MKVTDPNDLRFDPMKFNYCDYKSSAISDVYEKIFRPGDSKKNIDKILIDAGKANVGQINEAKINGKILYKTMTYGMPNKLCNPHLKKPPHHIFLFNSEDKLINIYDQLGAYVYLGQPTKEELNNQAFKYKEN